MSILVVGSVALDSVETPFGTRDRVLGGSATYFSTSASFFTDVNLVAVVGEDFPEEHTRFLRSRNIDPELQLEVLNQVKKPRVVACDTMNFWISSKPEALKKVISRVDFFIINEGEARQLSGEANLVRAARSILALGVKNLIVKRGEYGVLMFNGHSVFAAPAYPLEEVFDPTGAGDTFAGGFMGYLANTGDLSEEGIRQAVIFGSVMASFNVEAFSLDRLKVLEYKEIEARYRAFKRMTHFEGVGEL